MGAIDVIPGSLPGGRSENQDYFGHAVTDMGLLIVVCDGMGGANGGATASHLAVDTILKEAQTSGGGKEEDRLRNAIRQANRAIYEAGAADPDLQGMGTTVAALLLNDRYGIACHVGDSRIYQIRKGRKVFRTNDHSMVFELVKRKALTEEEARTAPNSNIITRALGLKPDVKIEMTSRIPYRSGDLFLLCTDGVWGVFPEKKLLGLLASSDPLERLLSRLLRRVDEAGIAAGNRHDNLTAVLAKVKNKSRLQPLAGRIKRAAAGLVAVLAVLLLFLGVLSYTGSPVRLPFKLRLPWEAVNDTAAGLPADITPVVPEGVGTAEPDTLKKSSNSH